MKILALDTSTEAFSVALHVEGEVSVFHEIAPRQHANLILPTVERLLTDAGLSLSGLDALAFGCGPGSFTGIRIATGVIQGLAFSADLPVVPVSTLQTMAQGSYRIHAAKQVLVALDARIDQVYFGGYVLGDNGLMQIAMDECVCDPDSIEVEGEWMGVGLGWSVYESTMKHLVKESYELYPHAVDMIPLAIAAYESGNTVSAEKAIPVYLRDEVVRQ